MNTNFTVFYSTDIEYS